MQKAASSLATACAHCCLGCSSSTRRLRRRSTSSVGVRISSGSRPSAMTSMQSFTLRWWSGSSIFSRVEACDREALQVNCRSPAGARAHLSNVELTARGIERRCSPRSNRQGATAADLQAWCERAVAGLAAAAAEPGAAVPRLDATGPFRWERSGGGNISSKERDRRVLEDNQATDCRGRAQPTRVREAARPPRLRPRRSVTDRLSALWGGRADSALG